MSKPETGKYYSRDRFVSRYARRNGYTEEVVFHSPIESYIALVLGLLLLGVPALISSNTLRIYVLWGLKFLFGPWLLLISWLNTSFIIGDSELIVLNRNIPWWFTRKVALCEIESIVFNEITGGLGRLIRVILISECHYVQIKTTDGKQKRYYCIGLQQDYFDENTVRNQISDLASALERKRVKTTYLLEG